MQNNSAEFFDKINVADVDLLLHQIEQQFAEFENSSKESILLLPISEVYGKIQSACEKISLLPKPIAKNYFSQMEKICEDIKKYHQSIITEKKLVEEAISGINKSFNAGKAYLKNMQNTNSW